MLPAGRPWPLAAPRRRCRQAVCAAASPAEGSSAAASSDDDEEYYYSGDEDGTYYVEKQQPTQKFEFVYMNAEEAAAAEAASAAAFAEGMAEYAALQEWLLFRTWRFGLLFSGYLLLAASGEVGAGDVAAGVALGAGCLVPIDEAPPAAALLHPPTSPIPACGGPSASCRCGVWACWISLYCTACTALPTLAAGGLL